ncbi:PREDICTED: uncharacterized protein LOC104594976 [Nelumbo nucifera]|uniref:Uncharacterized protein LOC104594976 n=2 Tax=Nelumbo nucifera TaxID=4432 RepID=A0A1U7ZPN5_NELNU|nr:PREDICTED: uncharacterized protein LOC104594976 [Nelumbo nucifera]DAD25889.1 TPA_asm: hypothetical protein HUJ06_027357 [Nelumbo nucifera]
MSLPFVVQSILRQMTTRRPLLLYTTAWTVTLAVTVVLASFSPEIAFVSAISPSSRFSRACKSEQGTVRVPLDVPGEVLCLPAHFFKRSKIDFFVPPIFAAVVVASSACVVRAMGLWEDDTGSGGVQAYELNSTDQMRPRGD